MAKRIFNKRTLALVMAMVMCFSVFQITAEAAPVQNNWSYAYYLGQEYLGNAPGADPKPDPVGYGFQGVITSLTFTDDAGKAWTFNWSAEANGEWRITGRNVSRDVATAWPQITAGKTYIGFCGDRAYTFTLSADGSAASWTYADSSSRHANWFYYIRFIREYTVNVFYQNDTGTVEYNGVTYAAQEPLVRYFQFLYPNGNIIDDSEYEDGEYTDPVTLRPEDYLSAELLAQGYELKYATDAQGNDVMSTGVTISLLGENVLNVYCTLIPPKTENYTVVHTYYTEGVYDGRQDGGTIEVKEYSDFAMVVDGIAKQPAFGGNTYTYVSYTVDPANKVIVLTYVRQLPTYDYSLIYNANFGADPETKADSENITGTKASSHNITVDANSFVRPNYTFIGWNTEADGSGTAYAAGAVISLTAENNTEVLYAQWIENPKYDYTVIYNANFGADPETMADAENVTQTYAAEYTIGVDANSFSRPNHTFIGWAVSPTGEVAYQPGDEIRFVEGGSQTLYAKWIEHDKYSYTVIYNGNGGALPNGTLAYGDDENVAETYEVIHSVGVDGNRFVRENYTFTGWNTQPDGSGTAYAAGDVIHLTSQDNTRTLYAQWIENPKYDYSLTYNANFGTAPETKADAENADQVYVTVYNIGVDSNTFIRENYTFIGWNTEADGSGITYAPGAVITLTSENNTEILYAQWIENPKYDYAVTYNANFGTDPETRADAENISQTYAERYSIGVDTNYFVRPNYTFTGWNTEADGSGTAYAAGDVIVLTSENNTEILYAQWTEHPKHDYTLIYNANFGADPETKRDSESISGIYATSHTMGVDANSFVRANYTFAGWNTRPDGQGTAYAPGSKLTLTALDNTEILYAQWIENPKYDYAVTYNANFGETPETREDAENIAQTYAVAYAIGVDANSFVRPNYTFTGWNTEADGSGTAYAAGDTVALTSENNTEVLYAQWIENPKYDYAVTYNANFGENPEIRDDAENVAQTYAPELTIGVDANGFVRPNYTFIGWSTEAEGQVVYQPGDGIHFVGGGSQDLYAQWIEHDKYSYTVIYNGNGGALADGTLAYGDSENITDTYAEEHRITVDDNTFLRENYFFIGWNTEADGSGEDYAADDIIDLTAEDNTRTLYAIWEEEPKFDYAVTYNANFGEAPQTKEDSENIAQIYDRTYEIAVDENTFEREGYTFTGWNTEADGTGIAYSAADVIELDCEINTEILYAQWTINTYAYTVHYLVRVDGNPYAAFAGTLPADAPTGGEVPYGTVIDEAFLENLPASLNDGTYIYDYTTMEGIVVPTGANTVFVYYTYISPEPPANPPAENPPAGNPEDDPQDDPEIDPQLVDIPDEDVPLADVPKTGDAMLLYVGMTALSGLGLWKLRGKKEEEEEE